MAPDERVLVTGGAGCLGVAVIEALLDVGYRVRSLDTRFPDQTALDHWRTPASGVEWRCGDIRDRALIRGALAGCARVIHAAALDLPSAAQSPERAVEINALATQSLMEDAATAGLRKFVFISSAAASCEPQTLYGALKLFAEQALYRVGEQSGMAVCAVRPFVIFGPGRTNGISAGLSAACADIANRRAAEVPFTGRSWFDPLDALAPQIAAEVGRDETVLKPVAHSLAGDIGAMAAELSKTFGVPVSADGPALPEFRAVDDAAVVADALVLEAALARCVALCRRNRALSS